MPCVDITVFEGRVATECICGRSTMDPDDDALSARGARGLADAPGARPVRPEPHHVPAGGTPGRSPWPRRHVAGADAYQDALDRLESAEEVDLVIASVAQPARRPGRPHRPSAGRRPLHQDGRRRPEPDRHRLREPRRGDGSVTAVLDHADDVRSDHFVLTTPAGSEGAMAGLLGLLDYFQSPDVQDGAARSGSPPGHTPTPSSSPWSTATWSSSTSGAASA